MRRTRKILCLAAPIGALALMGCQRPEAATAERVEHTDVTYEVAPAPDPGRAEVVPASADITPVNSASSNDAPPAVTPPAPAMISPAPPPPAAASTTPVVATPRTDKDGRPACGNVVQKGRPRDCK